MIRDAIELGLVVVAFATLVTAHVALAFGLVQVRPRWHGAAALVLPPLAPWWGWRAGMRLRARIWVVALLVYVVVRAVSFK